MVPVRHKVLAAAGAACLLFGAVVLTAVGAPSPDGDALRAELRARLAAQGIEPMQPAPAYPEVLVELGRMLFFDPELSGNRNISCATCHHPAFNAGDGLSVSFGTGGVGLGASRELADGDLIPRNAPEIFNRAHPEWRSMFWDSRIRITDDGLENPAGDQLPAGFSGPLAMQAMFPVTSRDEMRGHPGGSAPDGRPNEVAIPSDDQFTEIWDLLIARLVAIPGYVEMFRAAYPDVAPEELTFRHAAEAIAAFEATAFTFTDAPWDRWLAGDDAALDDQQVRGAALFYGEAGCATCHSGTLMTDQEHHNIGAPQLGPGRGASAPYDFGRQLVTNAPEDLFRFRTPPLRNVALTGPWMHNGAFHVLEQAVRHHFAPELCWDDDFEFQGLEPEVAQTLHRHPGLRGAVLATLDPDLPDYRPSDQDIADLLAFLESLSSPSVASLNAWVPESVPSGLPVDTAPDRTGY
jgi:cytochrome c peroxidase